MRSAADPAIGVTKRSDYFALATVAQDSESGKIHLLEVTRVRLGLVEQAKLLENHYRRWRPFGLPYVLVEKVAYQAALIQYLAARGLCPVKPCGQTGSRMLDKETRASSLAARYEQGQIVHPHRARWLADYEQELLEFPRGEHDDMVDAVTYAVDDLTLGKNLGPTRMLVHDFTVDSDMKPETDDSGLYADLLGV